MSYVETVRINKIRHPHHRSWIGRAKEARGDYFPAMASLILQTICTLQPKCQALANNNFFSHCWMWVFINSKLIYMGNQLEPLGRRGFLERCPTNMFLESTLNVAERGSFYRWWSGDPPDVDVQPTLRKWVSEGRQIIKQKMSHRNLSGSCKYGPCSNELQLTNSEWISSSEPRTTMLQFLTNFEVPFIFKPWQFKSIWS